MRSTSESGSCIIFGSEQKMKGNGVGREKRVSKRATIWDVMTGKLSVPKLSDRAKNRSGKGEHPSVRWFSGRGENGGVGRKGDVPDQKARVLAVLLEHALKELDRRVGLVSTANSSDLARLSFLPSQIRGGTWGPT
jgi:hypothetical protein